MLTVEVQKPTYIIMCAFDECPITSTIISPREEIFELVRNLLVFTSRISISVLRVSVRWTVRLRLYRPLRVLQSFDLITLCSIPYLSGHLILTYSDLV